MNTKTPYPNRLDAVEMAEFTKRKSYTTGFDRYDRPYVRIWKGPDVAAFYLWAQYEQMYILETPMFADHVA